MDEHDGTAGASLTTDRAFDLLGDARRRRAVSVLRERDGAVPLRDLADAVVERAQDAPGARSASDGDGADAPEVPTAEAQRTSSVAATEGRTDRRKRVAASLHHCHLPKLDDADVVEYDPAANLVEATPVAEELEPLVEAVETRVDDLGCE